MTPRDPRIKKIQDALESLPGPATEEDRARDRYNNGTVTLADIEILGIDKDIEAAGVWRLVSLTRPFKAVRAVGYCIPEKTDLFDVLGLILSYGPDETPEPYLIDRLRDWLKPRVTNDRYEIDMHNLAVTARWAMGADDGLPLRQAIADGKWNPPIGRSAPHPGYAFCPLDCTGEPIDATVCFCCNPSRKFAYRDDVPETFIPWEPEIPTRRRPANPGHPRPTDPLPVADDTPTDVTAEQVKAPEPPAPATPAAAPAPYSEPGTRGPRRINVNRTRTQTFGPAHRRSRRW